LAFPVIAHSGSQVHQLEILPTGQIRVALAAANSRFVALDGVNFAFVLRGKEESKKKKKTSTT
jgi:hypothetical protein